MCLGEKAVSLYIVCVEWADGAFLYHEGVNRQGRGGGGGGVVCALPAFIYTHSSMGSKGWGG